MSQQASPHIHNTGDIIIPFDADQKYHFWNAGQHLCDILMELDATEKIWGKRTL